MFASRFIRRLPTTKTPLRALSLPLSSLISMGSVAPASASSGAAVEGASASSWLLAAAVAGATLALSTNLVEAKGHKPDCGIFDLSTADNMHEYPNRYPAADTYSFLKDLREKYPRDARVQWRFARAAYSVSEDPTTPSGEKKDYMMEALAAVKESAQLSNSDPDMHRWYGIILSGTGAYESTKTYIANTFIIRDHWLQTIELNPNDASAHHLLGRWSFDVASMSWMKRKLAKTLFAEPPTASIEEALEYFKDAERISPGFWKKNEVMLAQCCLKLGRTEEAVEWLRKSLELPQTTNEDKESHAEAEALLQKHAP